MKFLRPSTQTLRFPLLLLAFALVFTACDDEEDTGINISADQTWDFSDYSANNSEGVSLTTSLSDLTVAMKAGNDSTVTVSESELTSQFTAGNPSLSDISTALYRDSVALWAQLHANATGSSYDTVDGGVLFSRVYDAKLREMIQFVEKGLFNAAFFNQALNVYLSGDVSAADVDNAFTLYGAGTELDPAGANGFMAKYAARRNNANYYNDLRVQFLTARLAAEGGQTDELNNAIGEIRRLWEEASGATVVYYLLATIDGLSQTNPSDEVRDNAYHAWSEGVGFLLGFKTVNGTVITDAQIDNILALMHYDDPRVLESGNTLNDLQTAVDELAAIYGFSDPSIFSINAN